MPGDQGQVPRPTRLHHDVVRAGLEQARHLREALEDAANDYGPRDPEVGGDFIEVDQQPVMAATAAESDDGVYSNSVAQDHEVMAHRLTELLRVARSEQFNNSLSETLMLDPLPHSMFSIDGDMVPPNASAMPMRFGQLLLLATNDLVTSMVDCIMMAATLSSQLHHGATADDLPPRERVEEWLGGTIRELLCHDGSLNLDRLSEALYEVQRPVAPATGDDWTLTDEVRSLGTAALNSIDGVIQESQRVADVRHAVEELINGVNHIPYLEPEKSASRLKLLRKQLANTMEEGEEDAGEPEREPEPAGDGSSGNDGGPPVATDGGGNAGPASDGDDGGPF